MGYEARIELDKLPPIERLPGPPRIVETPGTCGGEARIDDTRVPIASILGCWLGGDSVAEVYACYPRIPIGSIWLAVEWAKANGIPDSVPYRRMRFADPGQ